MREKKIIERIFSLPLIKKIIELFPVSDNIYIVGGIIRDVYLNRKIKDLDLVTYREPIKIVEKLGALLGASFFKLREDAYRVVYKEINIDFIRIKEDTFLDNLKARDFTINALGIDLKNRILLDPCKGILDLKLKRIKLNSPSCFKEDPLRLLRAFRLSSQLRFKIEEETKEEIKKDASLLKDVSKERITYELFLILKDRDSYNFIKEIYDLGLLKYIFPQISLFLDSLLEGEEIWIHSLNSLKVLEDILKDLNIYFPEYHEKIKAYLRKKYTQEKNNLTLLKLAILFHDIGKVLTKSLDKDDKVRYLAHQEVGRIIISSLSQNLSLSHQELEILQSLVKYHMDIGYLSNCREITKKAIWRLFKRVKENLVSLILLSLADRMEIFHKREEIDLEKEKNFLNLLLERYFKKDKVFYPPDLLRGRDLIKYFKLSPGPIFKIFLNEVKKAYIEGKIKNKKEALKYLTLKYNL